MLPANSQLPTDNSSGEVLIRCENVSKKFCRDLKKSLWYGLKDSVTDLVRAESNTGQLRNHEFWANEDISFQLRRRECLGLIGRNGAGKTTLLKMLSGLVKPDKGYIDMRGKVAALIALGAGFNPVLTGRENILVNGSILGMSRRDIHDRLERIVEFAEIEDAIDSPVRTYSSGMKVRLGFSVAANLVEPDVLILDEILAVGDIGFVGKCLNRVQSLMNRSAVIFVSHNMQFVSRFCTRTLVLSGGKVTGEYSTPSGVAAYFDSFSLDINTSGTGEAEIKDVRLVTASGMPVVSSGDSATLNLKLIIRARASATIIVYIVDHGMTPIITLPLVDSKGELFLYSTGSHMLRIPIDHVDLNSGKYSFIINAQNSDSRESMLREQGLAPFSVESAHHHWGAVTRPIIAEQERRSESVLRHSDDHHNVS